MLMVKLKRSTIVVSVLCIALVVWLWNIQHTQGNGRVDYFDAFTAWSVGLILFYAGILLVPYYYEQSKYIKTIRWVAFILSILPPIIFLILAINLISGLHC
jgi:hypothetical protein